MTSPPLRPWIGVQYDGTVICAHCNCMAGAGEACSHVAALLYAAMAKANLTKQLASTITQIIFIYLGLGFYWIQGITFAPMHILSWVI